MMNIRKAHERGHANHAWLHIAEGAVELDGTPLEIGDAAAIQGGHTLKLSATQTAQILLFDLQ